MSLNLPVSSSPGSVASGSGKVHERTLKFHRVLRPIKKVFIKQLCPNIGR